jgi:hypothetical protein
MTLLPGTNYMSNAARTEAEMKVALDKVNEVIAEIGSKDVTTLIISGAGAITTPLSSMVSVMPEGSGVADTLSSIGVSNIDKGRMVILQHAEEPLLAANGITITHGTTATEIEMLDGADFVLCAKRKICLIYTGATGHWKEVWRGYGRETETERLAERTDIGLGTASVENVALSAADSEDKILKVKAGTNLGTGNVLGVDLDGRIVGTTISTNANTLDNLDSEEFVRKTGTAAQSIDADLTVATTNASLIADGTSTAALRLKASGIERAFIDLVAADGEMTIGTKAAGGGATVGMKFDPAAGNSGSGGRIVSGVGDIVADMIEANLVSAGDASAGSFRVAAGAYNLLVQWGGTWVYTESENNPYADSGGYYTLTFAEAFTSTPHVMGAGYSRYITVSGGSGYGSNLGILPSTTNVYAGFNDITSTYMRYPGPGSPSGSYLATQYNPDKRFHYRRSGNYIAIGIVA